MKTKKDILDNKGWTIPSGTEIKIIKTIINPSNNVKNHIVTIDNGTGLEDTFPKTIITEGALNRGLN